MLDKPYLEGLSREIRCYCTETVGLLELMDAYPTREHAHEVVVQMRKAMGKAIALESEMAGVPRPIHDRS